LRRLVVERLVRTEGARRGTRYFVDGSADIQNGRRATVEAAAAAAAAVASSASSASVVSADDPPG
jgi:predicted pyridoxine 5'-phosphate oxidase superfamily flavin-nucleotide-binding protein